MKNSAKLPVLNKPLILFLEKGWNGLTPSYVKASPIK